MHAQGHALLQDYYRKDFQLLQYPAGNITVPKTHHS